MSPLDRIYQLAGVLTIVGLLAIILMGCTPDAYGYETFNAIGKTFIVEDAPWDAPNYIRIDWDGDVLAGDYEWDLNDVYGEYTSWNQQVVVGGETYKLEEDLTADWCQFGYCN